MKGCLATCAGCSVLFVVFATLAFFSVLGGSDPELGFFLLSFLLIFVLAAYLMLLRKTRRKQTTCPECGVPITGPIDEHYRQAH